MAKKLPLKLRVFEYLTQVSHPVTSTDVVKALENEYKGEKQMCYSRIDNYMQALLGVNMVKQSKVEFDNQGDLEVYYEVSDFGRSRIKYIPKR